MGTLSYGFYYRSFAKVGAFRSMALDVTYCLWATLFTCFSQKQMPSFITFVAGCCILFGTFFAVKNGRK